MGNSSSLAAQEIASTSKKHPTYSSGEIKSFHENYRRLDKTQKGFVSSYDLKQVAGIGQTPFGDRMTDTLASNQTEVSFSSLADILLTSKNDLPKKQLLFSMIDVSNDGLIDENDLKFFFSEVLKPQLTEKDLESLIKSIITVSTKGQKQLLDFKDFCAFLGSPIK